MRAQLEYNPASYAPQDPLVDLQLLQPRLLGGETMVALMETEYVPSSQTSRPLDERYFGPRLKETMYDLLGWN